MPAKPKQKRCPYNDCGTTRYKSLRESKYCRACGNRVWTALGDWITDERHDDILDIVHAFENYLSTELSDPDFHLTGGSLRAETNFAAQLLYKCGWDHLLASYVMSHKLKGSRKMVESISWVIGYDFDKNLSLAKSDIKRTQEEARKAQTVASIVNGRSDLFDDRGVDSTG